MFDYRTKLAVKNHYLPLQQKINDLIE